MANFNHNYKCAIAQIHTVTLHFGQPRQQTRQKTTYPDTQVHIGVHPDTQVHTGVHPDTQVYTGVYPDTQVHTGVHPDTQVHTGVHPDTQVDIKTHSLLTSVCRLSCGAALSSLSLPGSVDNNNITKCMMYEALAQHGDGNIIFTRT